MDKIVLDSNRGVIKAMKPGITKYAELDKLSKLIILKGLQDIGILKKEHFRMFKVQTFPAFICNTIDHSRQF